MNKKVIALAVAGALALPLAANAQTANVTMYGSFRMALETQEISGGTPSATADKGRKTDINSYSSRWGIRGIEAIGGGLNGIFHLETGVNIDFPGGVALDGTTIASQFISIRESWVGLNGGFGTVKMGAGLTPYDDVFGMDHLMLSNGLENFDTLSGGVNPNMVRGGNFTGFGSVGPVGVAGGVTGTGRQCNSSTNFDARYGNSIRYDSPNFSGLYFATQYAFLGENNRGSKCKGWDSAVVYRNGPIEAGLGYAKHADFSTYDGDAWRLHAGYDAGVVKVLGGYERIHLKGDNGSSGDAKTGAYVIGVQVPVGAGTISAQYGSRNKGAVSTATATAEVDNGGGRQYSLGYIHNLSKRTHVFAFVARVKAEDGATIEGSNPGGKSTGVAFGIRHNF
jgi:predicted porin